MDSTRQALIIRRSAVQVRLPLPDFPYKLHGSSRAGRSARAGTMCERYEHKELRGAQESAQGDGLTHIYVSSRGELEPVNYKPEM